MYDIKVSPDSIFFTLEKSHLRTTTIQEVEMAPSQAPVGLKPNPGHGKAKPRRSKRTIALAKQQKKELMKQIAKLELHQELCDEKAEHDATKAMADRLRLQHKDLVTRLDDAETAIANAESRAWNSEKEVIKLRESLSKSRAVAQNNETYIALVADENQQLEAANVRIAARTVGREGELRWQIEVMEEQARDLKQSLGIAYKNIQEYGILFQKNTADWAELAGSFNKHRAENSDRAQELQHSIAGYYEAIEWFEDEANRLFQAGEKRIARNRLHRDKPARRASADRSPWHSRLSQSGSRSSSDERFHRAPLTSEELEYDSNSWHGPGDFSQTDIKYMGRNQPGQRESVRIVPGGPRGAGDASVELAKDDQRSLNSLAPLVDEIQSGFATFYVNKTGHRDESKRSVHGKNSSWDKYAYNHRRLGSSREQIARDSLSPEATGGESSLDGSWSIPSLSSGPTRMSDSHLSSLSSESWNHVEGQQKPNRVDQPGIRDDWSQLKLSPVFHDHLSIGYESIFNTSRKRIRLAPRPEPSSDIEDQEQPGIEPTDCGIPTSRFDPQIVNSELTGGQWQGMSVFRESVSKAIQTDKALLLAHPDNLAASSMQALAVTPKGPLGAGAKKRSLSVGDPPRMSGGKATFKRMPGSWPLEAIFYADDNPIVASEVAGALSQLLRASIEKLLRLLDPAHPHCIVYPGLMALWIWQAYENHVEWKRWERANSFAQQLRIQYAFQIGWVDSVGYGVSQWLAFDRTLFG